ncbi:hypothetical protein L6452_19447 [Arctium lappa]|uniref:Uncharacterized protein n=1 Tax=Arctium lappa TaxID=4217 RepID=A0ACB9BD05_ARCLA|nr:hypothetical protein L6452_19447 [Arctium lappa]
MICAPFHLFYLHNLIVNFQTNCTKCIHQFFVVKLSSPPLGVFTTFEGSLDLLVEIFCLAEAPSTPLVSWHLGPLDNYSSKVAMGKVLDMFTLSCPALCAKSYGNGEYGLLRRDWRIDLEWEGWDWLAVGWSNGGLDSAAIPSCGWDTTIIVENNGVSTPSESLADLLIFEKTLPLGGLGFATLILVEALSLLAVVLVAAALFLLAVLSGIAILTGISPLLVFSLLFSLEFSSSESVSTTTLSKGSTLVAPTGNSFLSLVSSKFDIGGM